MTGIIKDNRLFKSEILRTRKDFNLVFTNSKIISSPSLTLRYTESPGRRIGFITPKSILSTAVMRNRIKRYLREIYRTNKDNFLTNYTYLFLARETIVMKTFQELQNEVLSLTRRQARLYAQEYLKKSEHEYHE